MARSWRADSADGAPTTQLVRSSRLQLREPGPWRRMCAPALRERFFLLLLALFRGRLEAASGCTLLGFALAFSSLASLPKLKPLRPPSPPACPRLNGSDTPRSSRKQAAASNLRGARGNGAPSGSLRRMRLVTRI